MIVASIDIGTNTVLLLIAHVSGAGTIRPVVYEQRLPRLGEGVDARRTLHRDAIRRVVDVLREYRRILDSHPCEAIVVCATSAVRDAANREEFLRDVKTATGFDVEVLAGEDEALWTYRGAVSGIPSLRGATVLDIGGGSTEITVGDRSAIGHHRSLDIGSVRLTERFFRSDPPSARERDDALEVIREELSNVGSFPFTETTLVGVAGTATTLAILDQGLADFDIGAVTGYPLRRTGVEELLGRLSGMTVRDIRGLSGIMEGRADVIVAGAMILQEFMRRFGFETIIVSERGVRYGLVEREYRKRRPEDESRTRRE